ncbi:MAG: peptide chain release factor N(5)-glutamine methyltransferase [Nesterenkonia sp.]
MDSETLNTETLGSDPAGRDLGDLIRRSAHDLVGAEVPSPQVDAELLAGHVLGLSRSELQTAALLGRRISDAHTAAVQSLVQERARRIPLQHLTGRAPFRTVELRVGPGVFIPRPETEQVVDVVLDRLAHQGRRRPRVLDLGTGSGAIAAAVAAEFPAAEVHAVEVSAEAAAWAELNLAPYGVTLHRRDLRELPEEWQEGFDVVVSNPPYIPTEAVPTEVEVREHDPQVALYGGGADGLQLPRAVIAAAGRVLKPGGWFIIEHAEAQAEALRQICAADAQLMEIATHPDLTGRPRATSARVRSGSRPAPREAD